MDLLHHLRLFVRVAETGSFSATARENGVTQPTVSKQIAQLEAHLQVRLFGRGASGLRLTDAGQALYERSRDLVERADALHTEVAARSEAPSGMLRVSCPVAFGQAYLAPMLLELVKTHAGLTVDLLLNDRWHDVMEEGIDVAVRFGPLPDSRLVARQIGVSPQVCLAAPAYLREHGEPRTPHELSAHRCITNNLLSPHGHWRFATPAGGELRVQVSGNFRANNLQAIRQAVLAGNGIAVGPLWIYFEDIQRDRVRRILSGFEPAPLAIHALHMPGAQQSAKVRSLVDALVQKLATMPAFSDGAGRGGSRTRAGSARGGRPRKPPRP